MLIWSFGLGSFATKEMLTNWTEELGLIGIGTLNTTTIVIIAVFLLGTVEVIRAAATTLGEEIGWRGFFIIELRKVLSLSGVSIFSGIVWATWLYYSIIALKNLKI